MCTVLLPQGVNTTAVNKYISCHISYRIVSYRILSYHISVLLILLNYITKKRQRDNTLYWGWNNIRRIRTHFVLRVKSYQEDEDNTLYWGRNHTSKIETIHFTEGEIIPGRGGQYFVLGVKFYQEERDNYTLTSFIIYTRAGQHVAIEKSIRGTRSPG
jgi:hypothetical protein